MPSSSGSSGSFATPNARTDAHVMEYRDRMPKHHRSMNAHTTASPWSFGNQVTRLVARAGRHPMTLSEALGVLRALDHLEAAMRRAPLTERRTPRCRRPRCGARCRDGHACRAAVVVRRDKSGHVIAAARCRMHGGCSTGPRTPEGRARSLAALARGRARRWTTR